MTEKLFNRLKKMEENQKRLKDVLNDVLAWIWEIDADGKCTYSNSNVYEILGYKPQEIVGEHFYYFFHHEDRQNLKKIVFEKFSKKMPFRKFVSKYLHKDGKTVWLLTNGNPMLDKKGNLVGYRGVNIDISEQQNAFEALQESEEHIKSLRESASNFAVYRLVRDDLNPHKLKVAFVSSSAKEILGIQNPMKFESWFKNMHPDDVERIVKANQDALITMKFDEEYRTYNQKLSEYRCIHAVSTGTVNENGWTGFVNGIMIDVTEKHRFRAELKKSLNTIKNHSKRQKELNAALNVLLIKRDRDKLELEQSILLNINEMVTPYLKKLQESKLGLDQQTLLGLVQSNLNEVTSKLTMKLTIPQLGLSPAEIKVANYVKQGKNSKEIALLLGLSHKTIKNQRIAVRNKLGITGKKINLRSYLLALDDDA